MHSFTCVVFCIKKGCFKKIFTILFKNIKIVNKETIRKSPLVILIGWSFEHFKGFGVTKPEKDLESSSWTWQVRRLRVEEIEKGQQEIQEKIAQMTKTVTSLTKEKGITDDPSLQREPIDRKSVV